MFCQLRLEIFRPDLLRPLRGWKLYGHARHDRRRAVHPCVARIIGVDQEGRFDRMFLDHHTDYSRANSIGSRGVFAVYLIDADPGDVFEIREQTGWRSVDRRFCRFVNGEEVRISREEVLQCLI